MHVAGRIESGPTRICAETWKQLFDFRLRRSLVVSSSPSPQSAVDIMLVFLARIFRRTPKHRQLSQSDTESLDSDTLLPSSTTCSPLKSLPINIEYRLACGTLAICSVVYLSIGFWVAHSVCKMGVVTNPDEFCMNHVNQYCKCARPGVELSR